MDAARQAEKYKPITDLAIQELLKMIARIGGTAAGSDAEMAHRVERRVSAR